MNTSAAIPVTQMILLWTLFVVLFAWMLFCAFLAMQPRKNQEPEGADQPQSVEAPRAPAHLRLTSPSREKALAAIPGITSRLSRKPGSTPVA